MKSLKPIGIILLTILTSLAMSTGTWAKKGGKPGGGVLWRARVTGWMVGSLMMRSMERSERVYNAMLARGYSGEVKTLKRFQLATLDYWSIVFAGLFYTTVILAALFF